MIWGPFALAIVLGTILAAGVYVAYRWPEDEPIADPVEREDETAPAGPATNTSADADSGA